MVIHWKMDITRMLDLGASNQVKNINISFFIFIPLSQIEIVYIIIFVTNVLNRVQ